MSETEEEFVDTFNGDTPHLLRCTAALLDLDAKGALVPHGLGNDARVLLGALASRLARRGAALQWRPIEEAPKEAGKYLLGWNGHHSGVIQYWPPAYEDDPEWVDESTEFIEPPITHFMPIPSPPAGETNE